jgi:DNA-binding MarR family transcriptional regulator
MNKALEDSLMALRRIARQNTSNTKEIAKKYDLASSDLLTLQTISDSPSISPGELAKALGLSPVTSTVILQKLENRQLVRKVKSLRDKRRLEVELTQEGLLELHKAALRSHTQFASQFEDLPTWEQHQIAAVLEKVAYLTKNETP